MRVIGYDRDFALIRPGYAPVLNLVPVGGWKSVHFNRHWGTLRVPSGIEKLDLGATAKALAADRAAAGASDAAGCGVLVSLGGDIATAGAGSRGRGGM